MKKLKVGINGFGRIGRCLLRLGLEDINIVAINSRSSINMAAYLLKYDSVHGTYNKTVDVKNKNICIDNKQIAYSSYDHPSQIPWEKWEVDVVLECAGVFKTKTDLQAHFKKGVKNVFVAAPITGGDFTLIYGVNHNEFNPKQHKIISNGSCTTNCLAPIVKLLDQKLGIKDLAFTTIHSYTQDQNLLDASHKKDFRRARAAALSMIPTSTGASEAIVSIFPHLKNKIKGMSIRVPTANVSLVDMVFSLKNKASVKCINDLFLAAETQDLKSILACESSPLVSIDFNGNTNSCIIDLSSTMVTQGGLVKILAWYDNETGFSQRMINFINKFLT